MRRRWVVTAVVLMGTGTVPALAVEPSWHTGIQIAPPATRPGAPAAALAAGGEGVAAWPITVRTGARMQIRTRHGFVSPWRIEWTSGTYRSAPSAPASGANAAGAAVVVWRVPNGPVRSAVRASRTGSWRVLAVPAPVVSGPRTFVSPQATVAPDGSATVAWAALEDGVWMVRGARRNPSGAWTATPPLTTTGAGTPTVRLNASGDAVAAWIVPRPGTEALLVPKGPVHVTRRAATGDWEPARVVGESEGGADVGIGSDGGVAAAWSAASTTDVPDVVVARAAPGGAWLAPGAVASGVSPRVAVNGSGAMFAAWSEPERIDQPDRLWASLNRQGSWSPAAPVGAWTAGWVGAVENLRTQTTMDESGRAFLTWVDPGPPGYAVAAATAGADGVFTGFGANADSGNMALATDGRGNALVLYPQGTATGDTISAASWDLRARPDVRAVARGVWLPKQRSTRWTITVRNRSAVTARGVRLDVSVCCGDRVRSTAPPAASPTARVRRWTLGTLRPGQQRRVRIVTRLSPRATQPHAHFGDVRAICIAARPIAWGAIRRPLGVAG